MAKVLTVIYCCCYVAMAGEYSNGTKSSTTTITPSSGAANSLRESSTANDQPLNDQTDGKGRVDCTSEIFITSGILNTLIGLHEAAF